jgi:hypothetical protein
MSTLLNIQMHISIIPIIARTMENQATRLFLAGNQYSEVEF